MNVGTTTAAAMIHGLMAVFAEVEACATVRVPEVVARLGIGTDDGPAIASGN
jgi:hypothetical protein